MRYGGGVASATISVPYKKDHSGVPQPLKKGGTLSNQFVKFRKMNIFGVLCFSINSIGRSAPSELEMRQCGTPEPPGGMTSR